jgi:hypothetical protein
MRVRSSRAAAPRSSIAPAASQNVRSIVISPR